MQYLKHMLAGAALVAALQVNARAAETVHLTAPYAYGLLASATCEKGDANRLKALVSAFAKVAGATSQPAKADGRAYCKVFTKEFPVDLKWATAILTQADAAGSAQPQPQSDPQGGKGDGVRLKAIEVGFLGLTVKIKFAPKQPADKQPSGDTAGGGGREEGGGEEEGGEEAGGEEGGSEGGGEPTTPAN